MKYSNGATQIVCMMTNSTCYKGTTKMKIKGVLWHSTGANNPWLKRYVQPTEGQYYSSLVQLIGKNTAGNDWNHISRNAGVNAWIGKLADGSITSVQTLPWNYTPWGCGGACNDGWIQFEICEDALTDPAYFQAVYQEACELTAYLCKTYGIDPWGSVYFKGKNVPTILCHQDSYKLGLGSNHGDIYHWFNRYGKTMNDVRNDVAKIIAESEKPAPAPAIKPATPTKPIIKEEEEEVTQAQFNEMMNVYLTELAKKNPSSWSKDARAWAEKEGLISGDGAGNKMYKKYLTREEMAQILYRLHGNG